VIGAGASNLSSTPYLIVGDACCYGQYLKLNCHRCKCAALEEEVTP
jgi:hypothetical protein